jgi:hypothetical protein
MPEARQSITSAEFGELVNRMRIRHIEEIENRTGKPLDELLGLAEVGIRAHAIAYVVAVSKDPDVTWESVADGEIVRLDDGEEGAGDGAAVPTPPRASGARRRNAEPAS